MVRLARLDENNGVGETITTFRNGQMQTAFVIAYSTSNKHAVNKTRKQTRQMTKYVSLLKLLSHCVDVSKQP